MCVCERRHYNLSELVSLTDFRKRKRIHGELNNGELNIVKHFMFSNLYRIQFLGLNKRNAAVSQTKAVCGHELL